MNSSTVWLLRLRSRSPKGGHASTLQYTVFLGNALFLKYLHEALQEWHTNRTIEYWSVQHEGAHVSERHAVPDGVVWL